MDGLDMVNLRWSLLLRLKGWEGDGGSSTSQINRFLGSILAQYSTLFPSHQIHFQTVFTILWNPSKNSRKIIENRTSSDRVRLFAPRAFAHHHPTSNAMSSHLTSDIPSSGGSEEHALENSTLIVVLGASGDLAKKKVSSFPLLALARRGDPVRQRAQKERPWLGSSLFSEILILSTEEQGQGEEQEIDSSARNVTNQPVPRSLRLSRPYSVFTTMISSLKEFESSDTPAPRWTKR